MIKKYQTEARKLFVAEVFIQLESLSTSYIGWFQGLTYVQSNNWPHC